MMRVLLFCCMLAAASALNLAREEKPKHKALKKDLSRKTMPSAVASDAQPAAFSPVEEAANPELEAEDVEGDTAHFSMGIDEEEDSELPKDLYRKKEREAGDDETIMPSHIPDDAQLDVKEPKDLIEAMTEELKVEAPKAGPTMWDDAPQDLIPSDLAATVTDTENNWDKADKAEKKSLMKMADTEVEKRWDGDQLYTLQEFQEFYGGYDEWDAALPSTVQKDTSEPVVIGEKMIKALGPNLDTMGKAEYRMRNKVGGYPEQNKDIWKKTLTGKTAKETGQNYVYDAKSKNDKLTQQALIETKPKKGKDGPKQETFIDDVRSVLEPIAAWILPPALNPFTGSGITNRPADVAW